MLKKDLYPSGSTYHTLYLLGQLLDALPGSSQTIKNDLGTFLRDPKAAVSSEHTRHFRRLREQMKDKSKAPLVREAVQNKIAAFQNPPINNLPEELTLYIFSFFSPINRLGIASVCTTWLRIAYEPNYWLDTLKNNWRYTEQEISSLKDGIVFARRLTRLRHCDGGGLRQLIPPETLECLISNDEYIELDKIPVISYNEAYPSLLEAAAKFGSVPLMHYLIEKLDLHRRLRGCNGLVNMKDEKDKDTEKVLRYNFLEVYMTALMWGRPPLVKYLLTKSVLKKFGIYLYELHQKIARYSILSGNLALIKHLEDTLEVHYEHLLADAAFTGNLALVKYLISTHQSEPNINVLSRAVHGGSVTVVHYLITQCMLKPTRDIFEDALKSHRQGMVKYFETYDSNECKPGPPWDNQCRLM